MHKLNSRRFERFQHTLGIHRCGLAMVVLMVSFAGAAMGARADLPISADGPAPLDEKRLFALGMIESGNDDRGVGAAGEISRYQIQPCVWKSYSESRKYQEPDVARTVACQHWCYLAEYFRQKVGRAPTDFDMYVLWNTRWGYYASKSFNPGLLHVTVHDRARRFVNLVNR